MNLRAKIITAVAAAAMAGLLLAGCSSPATSGVASIDKPKSSAQPKDSGDGGGKDGKAGPLAFTKCLREKGLDVPDPDAAGSFQIPEQQGKDQAAVGKIVKECQSKQGGTPADDAAQAEALKHLGACMRENGFPDFKDPDPNSGVIDLGNVDPSDPKFAAAQQKCFGSPAAG